MGVETTERRRRLGGRRARDPARKGAAVAAVAVAAAVVAVMAGAAGAAGEGGRAGTAWAEALLAAREQYAAHWAGRLAGVRLGPWHTCQSGRGVDPGRRIDLRVGGAAGWRVRYDLADGVVHADLSNHGINQQPCLPDAPGAAADSAAGRGGDDAGGRGPAYMFRVRDITAGAATTLRAWVGAKHGVEVWLNGRRVFRRAGLGNGLYPQANSAEVALPLRAGRNQLALRLLGERWAGFYFSPVPDGPAEAARAASLLKRLERDFPTATRRMLADLPDGEVVAWLRGTAGVDLPDLLAGRAVRGLGGHNAALRAALAAARALGADRAVRLLSLYARAAAVREARAKLALVNFDAFEAAVRDLAWDYPSRYADAEGILRQVRRWRGRVGEILAGLERGERSAVAAARAVVAFQRRVLLANPLLDFDRLLVIRRRPLGDPRRAEAPNRGLGEYLGLPQQSSWQLDRIRQPYGWDNEIAVLSDLRGAATLKTLYRPPVPMLLSDVDLDYDARRLLVSMPGHNCRWQVFEMDLATGPAGAPAAGAVRQVTPRDCSAVHNFDACYLPRRPGPAGGAAGPIAFVSTAPLQGVPCSDGIAVAMIYRMDRPAGGGGVIRRLGFDQDHDYCPTVTNDGRLLYLRWDYTDLPHQWPRILFTMNPDGSAQRALYGSNSYWPNAVFYARPVPGDPTLLAGIVTGHHVGRVGELVLFDPGRGQHEADGVVQRIPGRGRRVEPVIRDKLTIDSWPKFTHPWPLSAKYLLASCKPTPGSLWGIYLVDVFDNLVLIREVEGEGLFEPIPFRPRPVPPVVGGGVDPSRRDALMYVQDVYAGPGLRGVPRGSVKRLRLLTYQFAYPYLSGGQHRVGTDGPWEPKTVLGTVPVEADGSALFRVPAEVPISLQPLGADGGALQLMRSWTTAMRGEVVSCVGCHEPGPAAPSVRRTEALRKPPEEIRPWFGPARGFSFPREIQPILDRHCVRCHDGRKTAAGPARPDFRGGRDEFVVFDNRDPRPKRVVGADREALTARYAGVFEPAYYELRRFVRTGGLESDLHLLNPGEFHADTTELMQRLGKGHHGVRLAAAELERLACWIDLNAPCHGSWEQVIGRQRARRRGAIRAELAALYGGVSPRPGADPPAPPAGAAKAPPQRRDLVGPSAPLPAGVRECASWPFDAAEARRRQAAAGPVETAVELGGGQVLHLVRIPPGRFVMGDPAGEADERPAAVVTIERAFWMGRFEVTNAQYALFDPAHDSRHEHGTASFNSERALGPKLNRPDQPVLRVSWSEARGFCRWLRERTGRDFRLPTEAQWEYACRAGTATPLSWGGPEADFSAFANLADAALDRWALYNERRRSADQVPRDSRFNDGALVTVEVGRYRPNAWGLHDMHGNVWEWTRSAYRPYPYRDDDGRNAPGGAERRVVRGGSWYDRPARCRSAYRLSYPPWRRVYNVGFRVVCPAGGTVAAKETK